MSRKRTKVNEEAVLLMRQFVKSKSNLSCDTFAQIKALHETILKTTSEVLSVQTLSRFFGVIKSDFNTSMHTLDTLARYLDYESFRHFENINETATPKEGKSNLVFDLFLTMFGEMEGTSCNHMHELVRNVFKWMNKNPQFISDIYTSIAKTEVGKKLFFEDFVNVDAFNDGFGKGLHYYILHASSNEQKFYGYALSCYRYFITNDAQKFKEYYDLILQFRQSEIFSFHPVIVDRYYSAVLFNNAFAPDDRLNVYDHGMMDFDILTSTYITSSNCGYHVGEALVLTGEFQRAWEILNGPNVMDVHVPDCLKSDFDLQLSILKLISGYFSGNVSKRKCLSDFLELQNQPLPLLAEKYFSFFLLVLKHKLFERSNIRKQVTDSMNMLIETTGFRYLHKFQHTLLEPVH